MAGSRNQKPTSYHYLFIKHGGFELVLRAICARRSYAADTLIL